MKNGRVNMSINLDDDYLNGIRELSNYDKLVYWILERESIRLKKAANKPPPYTADRILHTYRWCNVVRADDRVTTWLINNWYTPANCNGNSLVAAVIARHINLPSTLEQIGYPSGKTPMYLWFEKVKRAVRKVQASGKAAYNNAYMIRGIGTADKIEMIVDNVAKPIHENPPGIEVPCTMRQFVSALLPYWGIQSFVAGQVVADLRWAWPPTGTRQGYWADRFTYAPMGPGSKRGMNRIHNRPIDYNLKQDQFDIELVELIGMLKKEPTIKHVIKRCEGIDIQSVLCETDKMIRTLNGEGKPKQLYHGAT